MSPGPTPRLVVAGSINMDLVVRCAVLPRAGETVLGSTFNRFPGGKGANQAVAAARLGGAVRMIGCVGDDAFGAELLHGLRAEGVDVSTVDTVDAPTGVALIAVSEQGENQIVVAPGANATVAATTVGEADAVLCQLEIPIETVLALGMATDALFCVNAAPARPLPDALLDRVDLFIVNEHEHATLDGLASARAVALTLGPDGAVLYRHGTEVARCRPPVVDVVDTTAAGDAFCGALVVALAGGAGDQVALDRAVRAGALACTRHGAQPSLPRRHEVDGS